MIYPITIEAIRLEGFRAYLQSQTVNLCRGKTSLSLAIFAPNAKGKSSLVDAFEYYFSEDATLARLGKRQAQTHAGPLAIEHVDAEKSGVTPAVHLWFRQDKDKFDDIRLVSKSVKSAPPLPNAARRILPNIKLSFIIRGYELRKFVEKDTPEGRYKDITTWFALDLLLIIQQNLRALRREVKKKAESKTEENERLRDLKQITKNKITTWNTAKVCDWFNTEIIAQLGMKLTITKFSKKDAGYQEIVKRKAAEDERLGISALKRLRANIKILFTVSKKKGEESTGKINVFENAFSNYMVAVTHEAVERSKASQTVFNDVWTSAKKVFENKEIHIKRCPVCDTTLKSSPYGSREKIIDGLETKLNDLVVYHAAEGELKKATKALKDSSLNLIADLKNAISNLKDTNYDDEAKQIVTYFKNLQNWKIEDEKPSSKKVVLKLTTLLSSITSEIERIEKQQGKSTYANALNFANELIQIKSHLKRIYHTKSKLQAIHEELNRQTLAINKTIVEHIQNLIGTLQKGVDDLYKDIQGDDGNAPSIQFNLPEENDANQQRIELLIDFAENRKGVIPSGYLSDSQIHTLALSLRLFAIRLFNVAVPIIVLDDVVTSYDADHRKNIAAVLAKHFSDFQIILVTHDEQFFNLLQDHLSPSSWVFKRITKIEPKFGPNFHDHRTPDKVIQIKLDSDKSAATEIRQIEEEWLLDMCRGFGVKVVIRPVDRPYQFNRSELADALASFLKNVGILPPEVPGISNTFLNSLQKGVVENFASHFSDNPYKNASIGDEKTRWKEFLYFRDQFVCPACGKRKFKRPPSLKKLVCASCETPFAFSEYKKA